eukprot:UN10558
MLDLIQDNNNANVNVNKNILRVSPQCTSKQFQKLWKGEKQRVNKSIKKLNCENGALQIEQLANNANFKTMASNASGRKQKFYFYAQEEKNDSFHLIECNINLDSLEIKCTVKGQSDLFQDIAQFFIYSINAVLAN